MTKPLPQPSSTQLRGDRDPESKRAGEQAVVAGPLVMCLQGARKGVSIVSMQDGDLPAGSLMSPGRCVLLQGVYK